MHPEALPTLGCPSPQILRGFLVAVCRAHPSLVASLESGAPALGGPSPEPPCTFREPLGSGRWQTGVSRREGRRAAGTRGVMAEGSPHLSEAQTRL